MHIKYLLALCLILSVAVAACAEKPAQPEAPPQTPAEQPEQPPQTAVEQPEPPNSDTGPANSGSSWPVPQDLKVGSQAPDFSLTDLHGNAIALKDFYGQPVMLHFWDLNCKACVEELPVMQEYYEQNRAIPVALLTISVGEPAHVMKNFIQQYGYTFPVLLDESADVCITYGRGAPTTFILDAQGAILLIRDELFHDVNDIEGTVQDVVFDNLE